MIFDLLFDAETLQRMRDMATEDGVSLEIFLQVAARQWLHEKEQLRRKAPQQVETVPADPIDMPERELDREPEEEADEDAEG